MREALRLRYWGLHVAMVVVVVATVALGVWQYDVWQNHKRDRAAELANRTPVSLTTVMSHDAAFTNDEVGRPVTVTGTWLPSASLFVSGHSHDGTAGYWVTTPVVLSDGSAVYIVRGWNRTATDPSPTSGPAEVTGWLEPPEEAGLFDDDPTDTTIPELNMANAVNHLSQDLFSAYVIEHDSAVATSGLTQTTPNKAISPGLSVGLQNFLYALEWWVFTALAVYLWWRWLRDWIVADRAALEAVDEEPVSTDAPTELLDHP